ncbi:AAA family ATPase [Malikia spinosa]|uniref:AAA family ATPase n=1 Tax=Malikia spinosa TaxID=86180 RepID=A0A7C9J7D3_9BURK|nr:AAA family ATPase [Malikia spinosa]MYZ51670.1 AAA family ATPase [Malikia spinosa]
MIKTISIANYKSIDKLSIDLGRINVFIGENGAGKSNILEAIALAGAASADKLDNEFLTSRGIRVTPPEYMRPAFPDHSPSIPINIEATDSNDEEISLELKNNNNHYSKWERKLKSFNKIDADKFLSAIKIIAKSEGADTIQKIKQALEDLLDSSDKSSSDVSIQLNSMLGSLLMSSHVNSASKTLSSFIIYSPENSALKDPYRIGQIEPLGINGEGLIRLITVISGDQKMSSNYDEIKSSLKLLGWFESLSVVAENPISRIEIQDKYIDQDRRYFDQLSANEGFLLLLFYFTLFASDLTPKFFAIDNIDASLNPKLCQELMKLLTEMSFRHDKQVILTTHNPAILDGINLDDDNQRLFVIRRNSDGHTRCERIRKPESKIPNRAPKKLSELFMSGALGGLPKSF